MYAFVAAMPLFFGFVLDFASAGVGASARASPAARIEIV
jgi:hypothetical protein